jgi:hypothetical protein
MRSFQNVSHYMVLEDEVWKEVEVNENGSTVVLYGGQVSSH